ncbi:hypothetical protein LYNGBM3L_44740 [Moorena producens 3L]|uniref:Uncharacterized protein n=1 Tax=Moorena producens 3L TaxID=489825 RepID=F4XWQ8_9CYAN|nr:hypothetical protein LYNGBM3L_44740 [Moorena producens 3L]
MVESIPKQNYREDPGSAIVGFTGQQCQQQLLDKT